MELSTEHQQKRRPSDSNMDHMTHKDNGQESDPQAGHKMSYIQATHDRRTLRGDVSRQILAEFRPHDPRRILVNRRSTLAWVHSTPVPRLKVYSTHPWDSRLPLWRSRLHPRGVGRTCRPQAGHDDAHQPRDHSCIWNLARWYIRPIRP